MPSRSSNSSKSSSSLPSSLLSLSVPKWAYEGGVAGVSSSVRVLDSFQKAVGPAGPWVSKSLMRDVRGANVSDQGCSRVDGANVGYESGGE